MTTHSFPVLKECGLSSPCSHANLAISCMLDLPHWSFQRRRQISSRFAFMRPGRNATRQNTLQRWQTIRYEITLCHARVQPRFLSLNLAAPLIYAIHYGAAVNSSVTPLRVLSLEVGIWEPTTRLRFRNPADHVSHCPAFGAVKLDSSYPQYQPAHQCASPTRRSS